MSGQNHKQPLGMLLSDDELDLLQQCVSYRLRVLKRKARWASIAENFKASKEYVQLQKLAGTLGIHQVVRRLASGPLGVPPRGARGLSHDPDRSEP